MTTPWQSQDGTLRGEIENGMLTLDPQSKAALARHNLVRMKEHAERNRRD